MPCLEYNLGVEETLSSGSQLTSTSSRIYAV